MKRYVFYFFFLLYVCMNTSAFARSRGTVVNCTDQNLVACVYNAKDSVYLVPKEVKTIRAGDVRTFACRGQGKSRCKVRFAYEADVCSSGSAKTYRVQDHQTIALTSWSAHYRNHATIGSVTGDPLTLCP
ncbi:MAG: hypothetical protein OXT67_13010 [Zetaproteobacteria bacterium]|nr:hypothetical protein [Zetaproteobacteria bacterium]